MRVLAFRNRHILIYPKEEVAMNLKKIILYVRSANAKLEDKFDSLSRIPANILIFVQLFLLLILLGELLYADWISSDTRAFLKIFDSVQVLLVNAASGACVLWLAAILIDYIDKKNNR